MTKFEVKYSNGDRQIIEAEDENWARHLAMEKKYGPSDKNRIGTDQWRGSGLSVRELNDELG